MAWLRFTYEDDPNYAADGGVIRVQKDPVDFCDNDLDPPPEDFTDDFYERFHVIAQLCESGRPASNRIQDHHLRISYVTGEEYNEFFEENYRTYAHVTWDPYNRPYAAALPTVVLQSLDWLGSDASENLEQHAKGLILRELKKMINRIRKDDYNLPIIPDTSVLSQWNRAGSLRGGVTYLEGDDVYFATRSIAKTDNTVAPSQESTPDRFRKFNLGFPRLPSVSHTITRVGGDINTGNNNLGYTDGDIAFADPSGNINIQDGTPFYLYGSKGTPLNSTLPRRCRVIGNVESTRTKTNRDNVRLVIVHLDTEWSSGWFSTDEPVTIGYRQVSGGSR